MVRIPPVPPQQWPPEMIAALAALRPPEPPEPHRGAPPADPNRPQGRNVLGIFAHHPELAHAWFTFNGHVLFATSLSERHREMLILRVASRRGARYEWAQHVYAGRAAGLDDDEIAAIESSPATGSWGPFEAALLSAVDELIDDGAVHDDTWSALHAELDPSQMLDVIFTVGAYETVAWMMRSVELELDDDLRDVWPERDPSEHDPSEHDPG